LDKLGAVSDNLQEMSKSGTLAGVGKTLLIQNHRLPGLANIAEKSPQLAYAANDVAFGSPPEFPD
jgi:hypothetical protein